MKKITRILLLFIVTLSFHSCYVNRTTVGDGPVGKATPSVKYSHAKQMYLFWGLVSLGQSQPAMPQGCGYQVKSSFNFIDMLAGTLTGGIFGMRTVKIMVNKDGPCDPAILKIERKEQKEILKKEEKEHK